MKNVTCDVNELVTLGFYTGYNLPNAPEANYWFNYTVLPLDNNPDYVTQIASRDDVMFVRKCGAGVWENWHRIAVGYQSVSGTLTTDLNGNLFIGALLPTQEVEILYVKCTDVTQNRPIIPQRDSIGNWWAVVINWADFTKPINTPIPCEILYRLL